MLVFLPLATWIFI